MAQPGQPAHQLSISVETVGAAVVIRPVGTVDLLTSPDLRAVLLKIVRNHDRVVMDLAGVAYMDSSGLATLVEAYQTLLSRGGGIRLASAQEEIAFVIELARLDRILKLDASVQDSLRELGVPAQ